jgi:hypothetical protein
LNHDTAIIGASTLSGVGGGAYVFIREGDGWVEQQRLFAGNPQRGDYFGNSVDLHGDTSVVGARGEERYLGAVYVFERVGTTWHERQKLVAEHRAPYPGFGNSVAISSGTILAGNRAGNLVHVFERDGTSWTAREPLESRGSGRGDQFGRDVAVDGDTALVGAPDRDLEEWNMGAVDVFVRTEDGWVFEQTLTPPSDEVREFGGAVSIDGNTALIGVSRDAAPADRVGSAYVFERRGGTWHLQQRLQATDDGHPVVAFGSAVAIQQDSALVGATGAGHNEVATGAVYFFSRVQE